MLAAALALTFRAGLNLTSTRLLLLDDLPLMLKTLLLTSCIDEIALSGRWIHGLEGSLSTSWASSSLSFVFSGTTLEILPGASTERKDRWNGGTPMIAIWVGRDESSIASHQPPWKVSDVEAGTSVALVQNVAMAETYVRVMMIDWASVFELEALLVDEVLSLVALSISSPISDTAIKDATITAPCTEEINRIIYIGDSISCGYSGETETKDAQAPLRGCLDAFPYVAQRVLSQRNPQRKVDVRIISYPGWTLVAPDEEERYEEAPPGMLEGFFQVCL